MIVSPPLPTQLIAEPPAGEIGGGLSFIGSPTTPQTPEGTNERKQPSLGSAQVGVPAIQACRATGQATLQSRCLPCHRPAASLATPAGDPGSATHVPSVMTALLSATGLPVLYLTDSLVHCAGASLGRPEQLGGPMRAWPIRASPSGHERRTATTVVGSRAARRREGTRGWGLLRLKALWRRGLWAGLWTSAAYERGKPVGGAGLWEGRGGAGRSRPL